MSAIAIATIAIQLLPTVETGVTELIAFINSVRFAAQQANSWTPALESAYRASLFATTSDPAYQSDKPSAV